MWHSPARGLAAALAAPVAVVATVVGTAGIAHAASAAQKPVTRLAGDDRIGTANAISQNLFPTNGSGKAVVLTAVYDFPDAMSAGPLAVQLDAPVLLTDPGELTPSTLNEIQRVAPTGSTVYVVGGDAAIASSIDDSIRQAGDVPQRIQGPNRYATSVAIAKVEGSPSTVLLATGRIFADALSASPAATSQHGTVLLTDGENMPPEVQEYLNAATNPTVYAVGAAAAKADPQATALFGGDRFATSALVASKFFTSPAVVGLATGYDFPDALAGGAAMGFKGGPMLVSDRDSLPSADGYYLSNNNSTIQQAFLFGGRAALSDHIADDVSRLINNQP